ELRDTGQVIGGATLLPLPPGEEFEGGGELVPRGGGHGYAPQAGLAAAQGGVRGGGERGGALGRGPNTPARADVRRVGQGGGGGDGVGGRDREIPRPPAAGIPTASRGPDSARLVMHRRPQTAGLRSTAMGCPQVPT